MDHDTLLGFLGLAEKLKCRTRHSWTSSGRHESVAEHVYRLMVFAWLVRDEFPDVDMNRVMELALFHDMGEAVTGDIPAFEKTGEDEKTEGEAQEEIAGLLPGPRGEKLREIFREVREKQTPEARLVNAMDKLEALIQHNGRTFPPGCPWSTTCSSPTGRRRRGISPGWRRFGRG